MNIDQFRAKFPNENVCRQFFESIIWRHGRTASAKNLMPSVAPVPGQVFTNVPNVNANLRLPPRRRCTAPSCRFGSGC